MQQLHQSFLLIKDLSGNRLQPSVVNGLMDEGEEHEINNTTNGNIDN